MKKLKPAKLFILLVLILVNVYLCITPSSATWIYEYPQLKDEVTYIEFRERLNFIHCGLSDIKEQLEIIKPYINIKYNVSETILGLYIGKIFDQVKGRPNYIVRDKLNID